METDRIARIFLFRAFIADMRRLAPLLALALLALPIAAHAEVLSPPSLESAFLTCTNADRAAAGEPALTLDPQTESIALDRAAVQAGRGSLSHDFRNGLADVFWELNGEGVPWTWAGENLAMAPLTLPDLVGTVNAALMASPEHRANILLPQFRAVAIGVVIAADGRIYVAELFRD